MFNAHQVHSLMEEIFRLQKLRHEAWSSLRTEALLQQQRTRNSVFHANAFAYRSTCEKSIAINGLLSALFDDILALDKDNTLRGQPETLDRLFAFLKCDIPAFRCGYAKDYFIRYLKRASMTRSQVMACHGIILGHCRGEHVRREFKAFARLAIRVADEGFVQQLMGLTRATSCRSRYKAQFLLDRILNSRKDLRSGATG